MLLLHFFDMLSQWILRRYSVVNSILLLLAKVLFLNNFSVRCCDRYVGLHEAFETVSFVALGKGVLAEFIQNLGECAHRARL